MHSSFLNPATLTGLAHALFVIAISVRVIMRRPPTGVALAWLFLVSLLPFLGALSYLVLGERRVSLQRARRLAALRPKYEKLARAVIDKGLTDVRESTGPSSWKRFSVARSDQADGSYR